MSGAPKNIDRAPYRAAGFPSSNASLELNQSITVVLFVIRLRLKTRNAAGFLGKPREIDERVIGR
jgi:hypothetical protein